ncbi:MAG: hypothetical protein ABIY70_06850 [Capsulimonas sp.]|uniref:WD40 repeat domain-containing protein n=1 Tax=Capsulimonas sp. TaxID=2494211 RepID=UPI0032679EE5
MRLSALLAPDRRYALLLGFALLFGGVLSASAQSQNRLKPEFALRHAGCVSSVAFSPDGKLLAVAYGDEDTSGGLALWDLVTGKLVWRTAKRRTFTQVAFLGDGSRILSLDYFDKRYPMQIWDVKTHALLTAAPNPKHLSIHTFAVAPDGATVALGVGDFEADQPSAILLWNVKTGVTRPVALLPYTDGVIALSFSPDGKRIAGAGGDWDSDVSEVKICDLRTRRTVTDIVNCEEGSVSQLAFSPKGDMLAVGGDFIGLRDGRGDLKHRLKLTDDRPAIAFSPDGETLAASDLDQNGRTIVKIWRIGTRRLGTVMRMNGAQINDLSISPHRRLLAVARQDGNVQLWRLTPSRKHE